MFAFILLTLINLYILSQVGAVDTAGAPGKWKVYGTKACGWTVKQLEYMKNGGKPHVFVDCANGGACDGMDAFPTLIDPNGVKTVGYKEV